MDFNDILKIHGYDPQEVRIARHAGCEGKIYLLWRNKPNEYEVYCRTQLAKTFGKQKYVAHFVATPEGDTIFTSFHALHEPKPIRPGFIHPLTGQDIYETENPRPVIYDVTRIEVFNRYEGKLCIDWGPGYLAWCQIAGNGSKPVLEIRREFVEPEFPGFSKFSCLNTEVSLLPEKWKSVLAANRGIYILVHKETQTQYVGSATGADGFFGRWMSYEVSGHGGNNLLTKLKNQEFQIGILEVSSSAEVREDILKKEQEWKLKLGSRVHGLNAN